MKREGSSRTSFIAAFAVLMLAVAVFGWGTQYKLSLYKQYEKVHSSIPHAKLLSQKEKASGAQAVEVKRVPLQPSLSLPCFIVLVITALTSPALFLLFWLSELDFSPGGQILDLTFFSFRPPPAYLPSI